MGCRALWGVLQGPQGVGHRRVCGMLQAVMGCACVGHCIVCYRIYRALVLCREGHAGSSVTPIQPFG